MFSYINFSLSSLYVASVGRLDDSFECVSFFSALLLRSHVYVASVRLQLIALRLPYGPNLTSELRQNFKSALNHDVFYFIIAPPSSIEIQGYSHNSKVEVRENQDLTLTCIVSNSKPAAEIKWYRGHVEYKPGKDIKHTRYTFCCRFVINILCINIVVL